MLRRSRPDAVVVFIAMAWLLGRWRRSPLRTHEWLLLGLGLSTRSWLVLALLTLIAVGSLVFSGIRGSLLA